MAKHTALSLPVLNSDISHNRTIDTEEVDHTTNNLPPAHFAIMIKPVGAMCNLRCSYCYYMPTMAHFGGHEHRMTESVLEQLFAQTIPRFGPQTTIAWQGGEPTLAGLSFFKTALKLQRKYARPGQTIHNALQTNGTLLTPEWCTFLHDEKFLVGISVDGPDRMHDHYRVDPQYHGSSSKVHQGLALLKQHQVEHNVLCVINDRNVKQPVELLGYFAKRGIRWLQFIPAVEWQTPGIDAQPTPANFTPTGTEYGRFLCQLFDHWFDRYRHQISIRLFDAVIEKLVLNQMGICILSESCHGQITIEHDGSVFGCDHFVEPRWQLGQVGSPGWFDQLNWRKLNQFAARKQNLPQACDVCQWREFCNGGCLKHRPHRGDVTQPSMLCEGYKMFYEHTMDRFVWLASYLKRGTQPPLPKVNPGRTLR